VRLCAASRVIEVLLEGADSRRVYARRRRRVNGRGATARATRTLPTSRIGRMGGR